MDQNIVNFLNSFKSEGMSEIKENIGGFIDAAKNDQELFIQDQGKKVEQYLLQLAKSEITKDQFSDYMQDIKTLIQMNVTKLEVQAQGRAQQMVEDIANLLIDKLIMLI